MKDLAVVIVNYNSTSFLENCLRSIQEQSRIARMQVVVVDNASADADWEEVKSRHPRVEFILNSRNLGFAAACNQGIRACPARYYLLLNPDTLILDSALDKTLNFLESNPAAGIAGCRVLNPDGSLQRASRRAIPRPSIAFYRLLGLSRLFPDSARFARYNFSHLDERRTHRVEAVSGSFLMFRAELLKDAGYLDESFFLYGEDLDFCFRALKKGWAVYYFAEAETIHHKRRSSSQDVKAATRHFYQAMKIFYRKHYAGRSNALQNTVVLFGIECLYLAARLRQLLFRDAGVGSQG